MHRTEPLPGLHDRSQRHLRERRAVDQLRRIDADVAVTACGIRVFAEIGEQRPPPAFGRFAIGDQGVEAFMFAPDVIAVAAGVIDELAAQANVVESVEKMRFGRLTVTPGAADLLVVGLDIAGQIRMDNEAHIRFVDAHTKGDGGDHDDTGFGHEDILVLGPIGFLHARVVGQRPYPVGIEEFGRAFDLGPRQAIDDPALAGITAHDVQHLRVAVPARYSGRNDWPQREIQ